jgi:hypothetical protein
VPASAGPTEHQSLPFVEPQQEQHKQQQKQTSSRASWLAVFSNQNRKRLKSTSAVVGKQKEHKSKATWILRFTYQKNKQGKSKTVCNELPETVEENQSSKAMWILDIKERQEQQTECTASQVLGEQQEQHWQASTERLSSPQRTYMRQKSNSLSRCSSLLQQLLQQQEFLQQQQFLQQQEFLPMSSSVGTKRRNSMWALGSSKSSTLRSICGL